MNHRAASGHRYHQQSTVSVFGQSGEFVDSLDGHTRPSERLQQRIGEPLRACGTASSPSSIRRPQCFVLPAISDRLVADQELSDGQIPENEARIRTRMSWARTDSALVVTIASNNPPGRPCGPNTPG